MVLVKKSVTSTDILYQFYPPHATLLHGFIRGISLNIITNFCARYKFLDLYLYGSFGPCVLFLKSLQ